MTVSIDNSTIEKVVDLWDNKGTQKTKLGMGGEGQEEVSDRGPKEVVDVTKGDVMDGGWEVVMGVGNLWVFWSIPLSLPTKTRTLSHGSGFLESLQESYPYPYLQKSIPLAKGTDFWRIYKIIPLPVSTKNPHENPQKPTPYLDTIAF